jgi:tRNA(fMet)-specific endonuclease VapC
MEFPAQAGEFYGAIRASLEARGEIIDNNDLWIAAHVLRRRDSLLSPTMNASFDAFRD